jgi:hypothetical protein
MPLRPVTGKLQLPVDSAEDVRALFEVGRSLSPERQGKLGIESYRRDLLDHFYYIGAVCPEYFRPLQEAAAQLPGDELRNFDFSFPVWLYLLQDASDVCVDHLVARLASADAASSRDVSILEDMLAGICTPYALRALAEYAAKTDKRQRFADDMGFWFAGDGSPAVPRFTRQRQAVRLRPQDGTAEAVAGWTHPVGLPIAAVVSNPRQKRLAWHYCSFDLDQLPGMPTLGVQRLHLVSPPLWTDWTVFCAIAPDGRYDAFQVIRDDEDDIVSPVELRAEATQDEAARRGYLELLPYDDQLTYCNAHTMLTPGVEGDVGGPPPLGSVPSCPTCGKAMFFVSCVEQLVREFGDGFRSLYVCEACMVAACVASLS